MDTNIRYLQAQKEFWNVDEHTARFGRVDVVSKSEAEYDALAERDVSLVFEGVEVRADWTVIEIGCGVGRLLKRLILRNPVAKAIGVDISENMIAYARAALEGAGHVELRVNSGADLADIPD